MSTVESSLSSLVVEMDGENFESIVSDPKTSGGIVYFYDSGSKHDDSLVQQLAQACRDTTVVVAKVDCAKFDYHRPDLLSETSEEDDAFDNRLTEHIFQIVYVERESLPTFHYYLDGSALTDDFLPLKHRGGVARTVEGMVQFVRTELDESPIQCFLKQDDDDVAAPSCTDETFAYLQAHPTRYFRNLDTNLIEKQLLDIREKQSRTEDTTSRRIEALERLLKQSRRADRLAQVRANMIDRGDGIYFGSYREGEL